MKGHRLTVDVRRERARSPNFYEGLTGSLAMSEFGHAECRKATHEPSAPRRHGRRGSDESPCMMCSWVPGLLHMNLSTNAHGVVATV